MAPSSSAVRRMNAITNPHEIAVGAPRHAMQVPQPWVLALPSVGVGRERPHALGGTDTITRRVSKTGQRDACGLRRWHGIDCSKVAPLGPRGITAALGQLALEQARKVSESGLGRIVDVGEHPSRLVIFAIEREDAPEPDARLDRSGRSSIARRNSSAATLRSPPTRMTSCASSFPKQSSREAMT